MKNYIAIVEIPTTDFARAVSFYESVLNIKLEVIDMEGMKFGLFPGSESQPVVQLISSEGYQPSVSGTLIYFSATKITDVTDRIKRAGGKIVIPKTAIGPDMGSYSTFVDSEGNKIGLHSNE